MEPAELAGWQEVLRPRISYKDRAAIPCADCLSSFAADMRAVGRCNGTPGGDKEDTIVDQPEPIVSAADIMTITGGARLARRVSLDVAAPPCESCVHEPVCEPVCGLRLALEGIADVETIAPSLPAGLHLSLAATVSCEHYRRDRAKPALARVLTAEARERMAEAGRANAAKAREGRAAKRAAAREGHATT